MKYKKILPLILCTALLLGGCGDSGNSNGGSNSGSNNSSNSGSTNNNTNDNSGSAGTAIEVDFDQTDADMFTDRDSRTSYENAITISLNGNSASCDSSKVKIEGSKITITDEGTYIISGTLDDGMIIVDAEEKDKPQIVFDNVNITSSTSAPLYILEADKVFVTLAKDSENTLTNGGNFTAIDDNNIDGTVFSKQDLTFNGSGSLTISSPAGHGIVAKDDLVFTSGTYQITSSGHGMDINDSLRVKDAVITVAAGKDGAHVENEDDTEKGYIYISSGTIDITAEGDGLSASAYVQVQDGSIKILAGGGYENASQSSSGNWGDFGGGTQGGSKPGRRGGISGSLTTTTDSDESSSMKGIKAGNSLLINGGSFTIDSADDAIHSNISVYVNGGTFTISSGDDALHGEQELGISNGTITINHSYEGLEALDISISGGTISIQANDDGINAAGGTDSSGTAGGRDGMFGGGFGGMSSNSNGSICISGGSIFMYAKGDGLDANGYIELTGGKTIVTGPISGDTAILDYDTTATITGGTFIGVGSTMMAQTFSDGTQGTMAVKASATSGTTIRIEDTSGNEIVSFTPETAFQCVIISTPDIEKGTQYTIFVGSQSGIFAAN